MPPGLLLIPYRNLQFFLALIQVVDDAVTRIRSYTKDPAISLRSASRERRESSSPPSGSDLMAPVD
jgi:hypothetical protein